MTSRSIYVVEGLKAYSRTWEVQRAPYRAPLPFSFASRQETQYPHASPGLVNDAMYTLTEPINEDLSRLSGVTDRARSSAISQIKSGRSAALGLTLLDYKSSLQLITGAMKAIASKADRKTLYYKKRSSALYLEGVFGWLPMIEDIFAAFNVLNGAHSVAPARGKNSVVYSTKRQTTNLKAVVQTELGALVGARGKIVDPNLALLGDLGLINPAAILWDKVPYSFVVNWFLPVGSYLNALTDLVGYEITDPFVTTRLKKTASGSVRVQNPTTGGYYWAPRVVSTIYVDRRLGFPAPALPSFQLPSADLFKSLVTLSLMNENLRKPARKVMRAIRDASQRPYTE